MSLSVSDRLLLKELRDLVPAFQSLDARVHILEGERAATRKPLADQAAANRAIGQRLYTEVSDPALLGQ